MTSPIAYRPVQVNDLPDLANLYAGMVREMSAPYPQQDDPAREWLACTVGMDPDRWTGEVAVIGSELDGFGRPTGGLPVAVVFGFLEERSLGSPKIIGNADWVYVHPDYRGRGISKHIIHNSTITCLGRGVRHIEATTLPGSHAEATWKALGFVPYLTRCRLPEDRITKLFTPEE